MLQTLVIFLWLEVNITYDLYEQALNSARPRQGVIDEGNMIYLFDLGINAAQAQAEVFSYLNWENELVKQGKAPEHHHTVQWLEGLCR